MYLLAHDVQAHHVMWQSTDAVKVKQKVHTDGLRVVKGERE